LWLGCRAEDKQRRIEEMEASPSIQPHTAVMMRELFYPKTPDVAMMRSRAAQRRQVCSNRIPYMAARSALILYIYIYVCVCIYIYIYTYINILTSQGQEDVVEADEATLYHVYRYIYIYLYIIFLYIYTYVYTYIYIYIYIL